MMTNMPRKLIDLTQKIAEDTPVFYELRGLWGQARTMISTWEGFEDTAYLRTRGKVDKLFRTCMILMSDHGGTHIDATSHINPLGEPVDQLRLDCLYGDGVLLDMTHLKPIQYDPFKYFATGKTGVVSGDYITPQELEKACAKAKVEIEKGDIVLLRTDADKVWPKPEYSCRVTPMTVEAIDWLCDRGVKAFGFDQVTIDVAPEAAGPHEHVRKRDFWHMENLTNLDKLPTTFRFVAFPLKWEGASASPIRAFAAVEE